MVVYSGVYVRFEGFIMMNDIWQQCLLSDVVSYVVVNIFLFYDVSLFNCSCIFVVTACRAGKALRRIRLSDPDSSCESEQVRDDAVMNNNNASPIGILQCYSDDFVRIITKLVGNYLLRTRKE